MTGENVEAIFNKLTETLIYKIDSGEIPEELVVTKKQVTSLSSEKNLDDSKSSQASNCNC